MSWSNIINILSPITELIKGWQERKRVKLENELAVAKAVAEAKIVRLQTQQDADIAWENTALNQSGIKDEVMMAVILVPMVMCFIPGGANIVREGFTAIHETIPEFWQWAFCATVGVSYGLRKFCDIKSFIKGK